MKDYVAYPLMWIACVYMVVTDVIYMFPFVQPTTVQNMVSEKKSLCPAYLKLTLSQNYSSVICGGATILITPWYIWKRHRGYEGPTVLMDAADNIRTGHVLTGEALKKDRQGAAAQEILVKGHH